MWLTVMRRMFFLMMSGRSLRSFSLSFGISTVSMPPRWAAISFSLRPPIGSTLPRSVISPVIATLARTGIRVSAEAIVVASVMPADGPSLGVPPSGTWMWMSTLSWKSLVRPSCFARERM